MKLLIHRLLPPPPLWKALLLLGLLALGTRARAQDYNLGSTINTGSVYRSASFFNAATATFTNTGSAAVVRYAGTTFTNNGTYTGSAAATDQFIGPAGAAGPQTLAGTTAPGFFNLTVANGPGALFTISNPAGASVAGLLTLSNGITTTPDDVAGALRLTNTGTQASALAGTFSGTHYVDGYVSKAGTNAFTFPVGDVNQNATSGSTNPVLGASIHSPITLSSPGGSTLRYTAASTPSRTSLATQAAPLQLRTVSSLERYPISVGTVPVGSTITLPYGNFGPSAAGTPYVGDPASLTIAAFDGTRWTNLSGTPANAINTTAKTVTVTLPFALATTYTALALASTSAANPLPVTLMAFGAVKKGPDGLVSWQTASETNSAYFELQASTNGTTWRALTKVTAAGNSTTSRSYSFLDKVLARYGVPMVYYRLRQVDFDAQEHYSPVVLLYPDAATWQVSAYPNPYETDLTAQLITNEAGPVTLVMLDAAGRTVLQRQVAGVPGSQVFALDESHAIATGTYTLLVRQNEHKGTVRVVRK